MATQGSYLQVPLLNLMANIAERAGAVHVRIGGNTQEYAYFVDSLPDARAISKEKANTNNPVSHCFAYSFRRSTWSTDVDAGRDLYDGFILYVVQHFLPRQRQMVCW
jgi:hypothetical protein